MMKIKTAVAGMGFCAVALLAGAPVLEAGFAGGVSYTVGITPRVSALGDFNRDGKQDMAVANQFTNNVSVLLGNGDGTFQPKVDYPSGGTNTISVAVGDFNGDGKLDLAAESNGTNVVGILLGNGDGTFQAAVTYPTGGLSSGSLAVADFNRDGKQDLATGNFDSNNVSILLGNGNGTFQPALNAPAGTQPYSVAAGDFNRDGIPDLAVANYGSANVSILIGIGNGTFAGAVNYGVGTTPNHVRVGDFNRDGNLDLAVANFVSNNVSILLGNGDGTFQAAANVTAGTNPASSAVGDFNGDGNPDLAVANFNSNNVSILLGNGDGTFQASVEYAAGSQPTAPSVGDFNGDGHPDLVVSNSAGSNVTVYINNASTSVCTLLAPVNYTVGTAPVGSAVGDFNRDGIADLAVVNNGSSTVSILLGNANGTFQGAVPYPTGQPPTAVAVGDFNRDGVEDLAVTATNGLTNNVAIFLGVGDGTFGPRTPFAAGAGPAGVAVGDFNGDGKLDLAVANFLAAAANSVSIFLGNGNGTFLPRVNYGAGTSAVAVAVGDFNGDGKQDVAVGDRLAASNVWILLGNGNGTLQAGVSYSAGTNAVSMAVGDFNRDGKRDLAVGNAGSANISILLGNGDGTFQTEVNYAAGTGASSATVGDFNRDGKPDLAVANNVSNDASILLDNCLFVTTTTLGSSPNPSVLGQSVTFTATVTSGTGGSGIPTGTVTFKEGGTTLGSGTLSGGVATFSTSALSLGTHMITATYEGDSSFATSTSAPLSQIVVAAQNDLSITKTDGQTTATPGSPITYTIVVSNAGPAPANGATVTDTVPAGITGASWTCVGANGGTCTASGGPNINDTVNLPVGGSVTYTLTGTVSASATSPLVNTAAVAPPSGFTDPDLTNNSATDSDTIPFACGAEIVVVPDGRLTESVIGPGATVWFAASLKIGNAYSVEFKNLTGSVTPPGTLTVYRGDDLCGFPTTLTTNDTSGIDPAGTGGVARQSFTAAGTLTYFRAKLENASISIPFSFSWSDTTMFSPAWSTNGSFDTFYSFQNTTGAALSGTLTLLSTSGSVLGNFPVSVPAGQTVGTNTSALGVGRNQTGTAILTHNGPPGAIVAEAAIANFTISPAYVQPVKFQPVRDAR